ncbi:uncharacterized protein TrAFT101_002956 [Trichoderma asperellum]|uniref:uncharacterized protein n=1 Tax=Trichoderma asperellum TaxID=101201 RepID=UPI003333F580|nr:hypothetical protein TrAFT101_002956 [Trichoderma asperellum]
MMHAHGVCRLSFAAQQHGFHSIPEDKTAIDASSSSVVDASPAGLMEIRYIACSNPCMQRAVPPIPFPITP